MDMLYHLPFRDWLELNKSPVESIAAADNDPSDSGDSADAGR
jgi:beta-lactamase class C